MPAGWSSKVCHKIYGNQVFYAGASCCFRAPVIQPTAMSEATRIVVQVRASVGIPSSAAARPGATLTRGSPAQPLVSKLGDSGGACGLFIKLIITVERNISEHTHEELLWHQYVIRQHDRASDNLTDRLRFVSALRSQVLPCHNPPRTFLTLPCMILHRRFVADSVTGINLHVVSLQRYQEG
jgi:hypothetical protein